MFSTLSHRISDQIADDASSGVVPDSDKSTSQSASDKLGRSKDDATHGGTGESILDKTKHAMGMDKH
jgi:hypothetical protein